MNDHQVVSFVCLTPYHLFVSYVLSKTVYKDNNNILILSDHHDIVRKAYENASKLNIWNEVILINEKSKSSDFVLQQLSKIDYNNIDVLHYFSWGSVLGSNIISYVSDKTKIILTEEGIGTHYAKEGCAIQKEIYNLQRDPIDFHKIAEIWLFDKRLNINELNIPLITIEFKEYLDSNLKFELCNELNILFDYKHENKDWDILFFDQYLALENTTSYIEEKYLLMNIIKSTKNFKVLIKKHPIDSKSKYLGLDIDILEDKGIPWEIIYLNEYVQNKSNLQNKIYITYDSSALLNTRTIFKDLDNSNHFISLSKLLINYINETKMNILLEKYYTKFKELYGNNFYEVTSFIELKNVLNNISKISAKTS